MVGEAADGRTALALTRQHLPGVVTMDTEMPVMNGVGTTRLICAEFPAVHVIALSVFDETMQGAAMREAGAVGYLSKAGPSKDLIAAIRRCRGAGVLEQEKAGGQ